jgi:hypothetical protein
VIEKEPAMRNTTSRCDQILQLIDECLGDAQGAARPAAPRPWAPTPDEVAAMVTELRPLLARMAADERARIESPGRRVDALAVAAA